MKSGCASETQNKVPILHIAFALNQEKQIVIFSLKLRAHLKING